MRIQAAAPRLQAIVIVVAPLCSSWGACDVRGATYYWDTNGAASGSGSAASPVAWLSNSWAAGSGGTAATGPWPNMTPGNADEAAFGGVAGTVTIGADVYVNSVRFTTNNYTVSSTGGALRLDGTSPKIDVALPSSNNVATITAPLYASNGITLEGNGLSGGLKFLVLAIVSETAPNSFAGPFTIAAGGALRIGGGVGREQIPDNVDLNVAGVVDFITAGGASDMKQEKVRDVTVTGAGAIFSVGNGTDFVVNSLCGTNAVNISVNGNQATVPGRLLVNGWSSGQGLLTLNSSLLKLNTTSSTGAIGGRIVLSGGVASAGVSQIINNNGAAASASTNNFANKALDFASAAHAINVTDGTLTLTSAAAGHPLQVTSLALGGTTLTKIGGGILVYEHAVQASFAGINRVEVGTLRIGANERLADASQLEVVGGAFDLQGFTETVGRVVLDGGAINGTAGATLNATDFDVRSGAVQARLSGAANLLKTTGKSVQLAAANAYTGDTKIAAGTLSLVQPFLANAADVYLKSGATLDLQFAAGTADAVRALFIDGVSQPMGVYGAIGSGAAFERSYITGVGRLQVTATRLAGDFDGNGMANDVDLSQWAGNFAVNGESDADGDGDSDGFDFLIWQTNVGLNSMNAPATTRAPEPRAVALAAIAGGLFLGGRRRRVD